MSDADAVLADLAATLGGSENEAGERRRYLVVADAILAAIGTGRLSPGDRLPNERDLARICDTSRTTVRDALLALELFGVVEVRPGSGCYVTSLTSPRRRPASSVMMDAVPRELLQARAHVEPEIVRICADNASPAELRRLRDLVDACEAEGQRAAPDELGTFLKLAHDFHSELGLCCGNSILADITRQLSDVAAHPLWQVVNAMYVRDPVNRAGQVAEHRAILDALERRDGDLAASAMRRHLVGLSEGIFGNVRPGHAIVRQPPRSR